MKNRRPDIYEMLDTLTLQDKKDLKDYLETQIKEQEQQPEQSYLEEQWDEIHRLIRSLDYEPYIDDQFELSMIWDICEEMIQSGSLKNESWDVRKRILTDIIENAYYEEYSVYDPIYDLFQALSFTTEEKIWCADTIYEVGPAFIYAEAARIYKDNGKPEKYYAYLESILAKDSEPYKELVDYYKDSDADKAKGIAELAMKKCTNDLTDIAVFLLIDAAKSHDEAAYNKLMKSAKLRRTVHYDRVLKAMDTLHESD